MHHGFKFQNEPLSCQWDLCIWQHILYCLPDNLNALLLSNSTYLVIEVVSILTWQINRRMEFVFASHSFDVWETWMLEGPLEECRLVNCRNHSVSSVVAPYNCICCQLVWLLLLDTRKSYCYFCPPTLDWTLFIFLNN